MTNAAEIATGMRLSFQSDALPAACPTCNAPSGVPMRRRCRQKPARFSAAYPLRSAHCTRGRRRSHGHGSTIARLHQRLRARRRPPADDVLDRPFIRVRQDLREHSAVVGAHQRTLCLPRIPLAPFAVPSDSSNLSPEGWRRTPASPWRRRITRCSPTTATKGDVNDYQPASTALRAYGP